MIFEEAPDAEITQVSLWQAYRAEFEQPGAPPLATAAEVIKASSEVFSTALPTVVEGPERKFIIKGIRQRDRTGK